VRGAAVAQVVAVDARDHGVGQGELRDGARELRGLVGPERLARSRVLHRAETAAARADRAEHHEGGRGGAPAFGLVGAAGRVADGGQTPTLEEGGNAAPIAAEGRPTLSQAGLRTTPVMRRNGFAGDLGPDWASLLSARRSGGWPPRRDRDRSCLPSTATRKMAASITA